GPGGRGGPVLLASVTKRWRRSPVLARGAGPALFLALTKVAAWVEAVGSASSPLEVELPGRAL
ncbi:hypothetical protein, partial [Corallococcus exiguus]|uniref:hypothetical protein n=1 Tax=Corallococcus exiguus TaxID=83462 RepID=UPI001C12D1BF